MGRSVHVRNRARLIHRGKSRDPRRRRREAMRRAGLFRDRFALDPSKKTGPWWSNFVVSRLLRAWRGGKGE